MSVLSECKTLIEGLSIPVETGAFEDTAPETYAYLAAKVIFEFLSEGILPERVIRTPISILTSECFED